MEPLPGLVGGPHRRPSRLLSIHAKWKLPPGAGPTLAACQALSPSRDLSFFICTVKGLDETDSPKILSGPNMSRCRDVPVSFRHASIKPGMLPGGGGIWSLRERERPQGSKRRCTRGEGRRNRFRPSVVPGAPHGAGTIEGV